MAGPDLQKEFLLVSVLKLFAPKLDKVLRHPLSASSVLCITTATNAEDNPHWLSDEMAPLKNVARHFEEFDISDKKPEDVDVAMAKADIIYVTGGNTYYLLQQMQKCDFAGCLTKAFARGSLYIGASVGAVVACPEIGFIRNMDDRARAPDLKDLHGLNLIDLMILPHFDSAGFASAIKDIVAQWPQDSARMLRLHDDQGIYFNGNQLQVFS